MTTCEATLATETQDLSRVFGPQGILAARWEGYKPRAGQVAFAEACHAVMREGGGTLCDAPCGTGKSVAYLVPAVLRAVQRNERVIVATAGIALQEQLIGKDLPMVRDMLSHEVGTEWKFAMLKGRGNYACLSLVHDPEQRAEWEGNLSAPELADLARVDAWAMGAKTGDRSDLPFVVSDSVWRMRAMDRDDCHGKSCEYYEECFARKAHERAAEASVVVVNYHLLFAHIAMRAETGRDVILPEHHALVMDEAHEAGDIAREFFGHSLSEGRLRRVVKWAREARRKALSAGVECGESDARELTEAADGTEKASKVFFDVCTETMRARTDRTLRSDSPLCAGAVDALAGLMEPLASARRVALRIHARVKRMIRDGNDIESLNAHARIYGIREIQGVSNKHALRVQRDAERVARACGKALSWMADAIASQGKSTRDGEADCQTVPAIHWIERTDRPRGGARITWESRHIDLSAILRAHVWERTRAVVACSATMTTGDGVRGWAWVKRQLGAPSSARVLSVPSPFDFARQALLCLPSGDHDPKRDREGFDAFVLSTFARVAQAAGGRTLGLFTSTRMAQGAAAHLRASMEGVAVLCQGDMPRTQLVQEFKRDETSVLCGTTSLWTGVDVQGRACVCVLIDKLPFAPPGNPVMDALQERAVARTGQTFAGFMEESLPRAVLALRQGVGRLIRSVDDWGCVVLCDPRLTSKGYGADILRALGMPVRTRSVEGACEWLSERVMSMESDQ